MNISNTFNRSGLTQAFRLDPAKQNRPSASKSVPTVIDVSVPGRSGVSGDATKTEKGNRNFALSGAQRVNVTGQVPLNSQKAISGYQQTLFFSQQFDGGQLVGVDLFV
jgi:hypothetical protein